MEKIRIGHLSTFYHTALVLMAREETAGQLGVPVEWRLFGTGPAIVKAFEKGELDLAYIGLPPAIIGIDKGVDIVCIAGGHMEGTVLSAKKHYHGLPEVSELGEILRQFTGMSIGVPGNGSIHDVILREYLEKSELEKDIEVANFAWSDILLEAVVKDKVAAAVGTPALAVAVNRYAGGKVLYPPSQLWPHNPSYGILAARAFLAAEKEIVKKFLILHEEASSFLRSHAREAARLISEYVGFVDEEFVLDTLKVSPKYCSQITSEYVSSTMEFAKALRRHGYITREMSEVEIFDFTLVRAIHPEPAHYELGLCYS